MGGEERQHGASLNGQLLAWTHSVTTTFAPSFAKIRATLRPMPCGGTTHEFWTPTMAS